MLGTGQRAKFCAVVSMCRLQPIMWHRPPCNWQGFKASAMAAVMVGSPALAPHRVLAPLAAHPHVAQAGEAAKTTMAAVAATTKGLTIGDLPQYVCSYRLVSLTCDNFNSQRKVVHAVHNP
jgi:hypothetical protein